jgi:hypothetical protein
MSEERVYLKEKGMLIQAEPKADRIVDGLMTKPPHKNAPSWIKAKGSIKLDQFGKWFTKFKEENPNNDWVNFYIQEPYLQAKMSINLVEFTAWIAELVKEDPSKEWVNFDIKESERGFYAQLDTWVPENTSNLKKDNQFKPREESEADSMPEWMKG